LLKPPSLRPPPIHRQVTTEFLLTESATTPDEEVLDEAFFRKYKNMSEPDKKKIRKILDAWEDE
jgi:hypothetical protein